MKNHWLLFLLVLFISAFGGCFRQTASEDFQKLPYNNPGLVVDLGVGLWAWPIPMDYDGDGDNDLLVSCRDKPSRGLYFFENTAGNVKFPVFKAGKRVGPGLRNIQPSYVNGAVRLLQPGQEVVDFRKNHFQKTRRIYPKEKLLSGRVRANQWKYVDFDADGDLDLLVGEGIWDDYGWDNAFDQNGRWLRGPLHGFVFLIRNLGDDRHPRYASPVKLRAGGKPIDVFGMPSPNLADFDGDGDLDLICGSFLDTFTYFENVGSRSHPIFSAGRTLRYRGKPITMDLEMIVPVAFDWDKDGDPDLVVGQEDGRVALVENTGNLVDGMPQFLPPHFFQQQAKDVKFGVLATPAAVDWDGDGDTDILSGNSAGYIGFIENLGGGASPKWAAPRYLKANGKVIRFQAGPNGSIQGPCEAKWGYTTLSAADWNMDGLPDLVVNSIWGKVVWYPNVGTRRRPRLGAARPVRVAWPGKPPKPAWNWWEPDSQTLVTQWRTTPFVIDLNHDGLNDLVMLDTEGYLAYFERIRRNGQLLLLPGKRIFKQLDSQKNTTHLLRLNAGKAGGSGRRKFCLVDWDGDGRLDLLVNSKNIDFLRNVATQPGDFVFRNEGPLVKRILAGHSSSPTTVDFDRNGVPDLLVGAEDGYFYLLKNPRSSGKSAGQGGQ